MAKRRFQLDEYGRPQVPWFNIDTLADFNGDGEAFAEHLDYMADRYEEIQAKLRQGEPHPMHYEGEWDDPRYQSELRVWENVESQERVMARNQPRPKPEALPVDLRALYHGSKEDKAEVKSRLDSHRFIQEQLTRAAEHEALGHTRQARDCRERAAQWTRDLNRRQDQPYSFQAAEQEESVSFADKTLSQCVKWDAQQLQDNLEQVSGMVQGFRDMSSSEHSYVLTGQGSSLKLSKVKHPGIPAKDLEARLGNIGEDNLLLKLGVNGVESREEPEEGEVESAPTDKPSRNPEVMSQGEFESWREEQGAKAY